MATPVSRTVGTTGDYLTWALAEADVTLGLVAADEEWFLLGQNEEFYVSGGVVVVGGQTTDATRRIVLDAEPGASFADNANKLTNGLRYNASNGCALRSGNFASTVFISAAHTKIRRLQIQASIYDTAVPATGASVTIEQCILQGGGRVISLEGGGTNTVRNTLFIRSANGGGHGIFFAYSTAYVYNCAVIRPSNLTPGDNGIRNEGGTLTVKNTSVFGFSTFETGGTAASNNNATDLASGAGTSSQHSLTFADQFEQSSAATALDLRTKAGSAQIGNGADLSGSGVTVDIVGTARAAPFDIGVWQTASSAVDDLTADSISAASTVGTPAVSQVHALTAAGVASASAVGTPSVTQAHALGASGVASAPSVGTPTVAQLHALTASGVAAASSVGAPAVSQVHAIAATGVVSASTVGSPALSPVSGQDDLTADSIAAASSVGSPSLAQVHVLTAAGITAASSVGVPSLAQTHALVATGIASASSVGSPALDAAPITTPASRRYTLPAMPRRGTVPAAPRSYALPPAARRYTVQPEG